MPQVARRHQPPITIRSQRAVTLLRDLTKDGRSQAAVIEDALERMFDQRRTLAQALAPQTPLDFDWDPEAASLVSQTPDFAD